MVLEIVVAVVAAILFAITYWMFWAGMAGSAGLLFLRRCHHCGRLTPSMHGEVSTCRLCRNERVARHLSHHRLRHYLPGEW